MVILAPNNTGKTTILRAIDFLFYGSLGGEGSETSWKLVTDVIRDGQRVVGANVTGVPGATVT